MHVFPFCREWASSTLKREGELVDSMHVSQKPGCRPHNHYRLSLDYIPHYGGKLENTTGAAYIEG